MRSSLSTGCSYNLRQSGGAAPAKMGNTYNVQKLESVGKRVRAQGWVAQGFLEFLAESGEKLRLIDHGNAERGSFFEFTTCSLACDNERSLLSY